MSFTNDKLREIIDQENGEYFSLNIGLNGYIFSKNGSFIIFDIKNIENIQTCHIKYIYFDSIKSLRVLLTYSANFWMGNKVQFIFYKEKEKKQSAIKYLKQLGFLVKTISGGYKWKYKFACNKHGTNCTCNVYHLIK